MLEYTSTMVKAAYLKVSGNVATY